MDVWVRNSQEWLNGVYGAHPGYTPVAEDGLTSWPTMYALTRALQIELGISPTSSTFGPTTLAQLTSQVGSVSAATWASKPRVGAIVQCALWCKGYWGHIEFEEWDASIGTSFIEIRSALGLSTSSATLTPKVVKSLLTMSAYTLVSGGSALVRQTQQWLNGRYSARADFYLVPCDGWYSRDVQRGLMLAIQYEIGMADGVANGNFGPGTRSGIQTQAMLHLGSTDSTKRFVRLFQAAMTFNGYVTPFDGVFGTSTESQVAAFQSFAALAVTANGDFRTWASLLVSTGDTTRPGTAVDCITTITSARAATLVAAGYQIVGRYLTNTPGPGSLNKNIKSGELASIFQAGLAVFPIFQEGGDGPDYFSHNQGYLAGLAAHAAAWSFGFPSSTCIYFAVDFDAVESEVHSIVVPHFEGIAEAFADANSGYAVGIYSARNTCSIVSVRGLAVNSFVSDMSTGYSGNLGFPLPANWAFDQILEETIGTGLGQIGIDKNVVSGRDLGRTSVGPGYGLLHYAHWLNDRALAYRVETGATTFSSILALQWFRHEQYNDVGWDLVAGAIDVDFIAYIAEGVNVGRSHGIISPGTNRYLGVAHLAAVANACWHGNGWTHASATAKSADLAGWLGDLLQLAIQWVNQKRANPGYAVSAYDFASVHIAREDPDSVYSAKDFDEDVDGVLIAHEIVGTDIDDVLAWYYAAGGPCTTRYSRFTAMRFFDDVGYARSVGIDAITQIDPVVVAIREALFAAQLQGLPFLAAGDLSPADWTGIVEAWIEVLERKVSEE